jgi:PAS domain S-box-containing protein
MDAGFRAALGSISRSRGLVRAATAVMIGLLLAACIAIWLLRLGAIADTEADDHRLGVVLAEQTARTFQAVDVALQEVSDRIASSGVNDLETLHDLFGGLDVHEALAKRLIDLPQAEAFSIIDATGHLVNASRQWSMPDYSRATQDYFRHFANAPDPNPYISEPGTSRSSGAPTVFLVRRLTASDGRFLGIVSAPILLGYFDAFFAKTGLSKGTGVTILRRDGTILVRFPAGEVAPGTRIAPTAGWYQRVAEGGGHFRSSRAFADHTPIFVSVHPLTLYPIVVDITRSEAAALARWWRQAIAIGLGALAATASLALLLRALGRQITLIEASQDRITQQVATIQANEAHLATQSALLETTLAHMSQGIMLIDAGGTLQVANQRVAELLDLPEDLLARRPPVADVLRLVWGRDEFGPRVGTFEHWFGDFQKAHSGQMWVEEHRPSNGTILEVRSNRLSDGGAVRTFTDMTEQRRAAEKLQYANVLLTAQMEASPDGILVVDANRNITSFNQRFVDIWQLPPSPLVGTDAGKSLASALALMHEPQKFKARVRYLYDHPDQASFDEIHTIDGRFIDTSSMSLYTQDGKDLGRIWFFRDVTETRQAEATLRAARDDATRSAQAKAEFLAMMSHEIRSPMSGLLGVVELLGDTGLDPEQREMIDLLHGSGTSLLRVLNDVLDFSKIDAGKVELEPEPTELRQFVSGLLASMAPNAAAKGLSLTAAVDGELPTWIATDPTRLRQILVNLLGNATKFTAIGSVRLSVSAATMPDGRFLEFAVSDSGIGIAPDVSQRLFEPFTQADASTTRKFGGTGLGLTISRRLARLLGGDIEVASDPGHGSVFTLSIPLVQVEHAPAAAVQHAPAQDVARAALRVLVAEDQSTNRWLIERQLKRLGYSVTAVEDGRAAHVALQAADYDLLITDCNMPEVDGLALTQLIRAGETTHGTPRMPILGLTADVTAAMRDRCLAAGMNTVVAKPIDLHHLQATIAMLLQLAPTATTATEAITAADAVTAIGSHANAVFDPAPCHELFADDAAEVQEWLHAYLDAETEWLEGIAQSADAGDRDALAATAHKLAGASLAVGAMQLGALGRRLEAAAAQAPEPELRRLAAEVGTAARDARDAILRYMTAPSMTPPADAAPLVTLPETVA